MIERRARRTIEADRKTVRHRSRRPPDAELRARLRELAAEQRRFGYRRFRRSPVAPSALLRQSQPRTLLSTG